MPQVVARHDKSPKNKRNPKPSPIGNNFGFLSFGSPCLARTGDTAVCKNSACFVKFLRASNRLLRYPGFLRLAVWTTLLVGTGVFFIGTIRPRKIRVPAVRSRRLHLPQAAAARSPVNSRGMRLCAVELFEPKEKRKKKQTTEW